MKTSPPSPAARIRDGLAVVGLLVALLIVPWPTADAGPLAADQPQAITLIETAPVETMLDDPGVPDAWQAWPDMIDRARSSLDVAGFYFSDEPGSRLEPVIAAIEAAGERGVRVRVLGDAGFYKTYPATLDRLSGAKNLWVRLVDYRALTGGVMHAKYFVIDAREAYLGSQNFDWRALEHIHEIGGRIPFPEYAAELDRVFDMDWDAARPLGEEKPIPAVTGPILGTGPRPPLAWIETSGDTARFRPAMSPRGLLPDSTSWDLPQILAALDAARDSIQVTLLTYSPVARDKTYWPELDDALRRAAVRGVRVRLLVADWCKRKPAVDFLKSLSCVPGIEVRLVTIPQASTGFIPFARVTHAKYMTVDGSTCWLGTSNWEKSYFYTSRNVGLVAQSRELTAALDRDFRKLWGSPYAYPLRLDEEYLPPRIGD